jgi:hypothetical protein
MVAGRIRFQQVKRKDKQIAAGLSVTMWPGE